MKKIFLLVALAAVCAGARAQHILPQAFAISSVGGILESKSIIMDSGNNSFSANPADVPITLEEAKNIFALNIMAADTGRRKQMIKIPLASFKMVITDGDSKITIEGKSDMLTDEMKKCLRDIRPGAEIRFHTMHGSYNGMPGYGPVGIKYVVK